MTDTRAIMALEIIAIKAQAKIYGPVIPRMVGILATKFVAEKLKEAEPEINTLDQAVSYITKSQSRYPKAFTTLAYGVFKAVSMLEGNSGAGTRIYKSLTKAAMETMGLEKMLGHEPDTSKAIAKSTKFNEDTNMVEKGITKVSGDYNTAINIIRGCDYIDVCNRLKQEGIIRGASAGSECTYALIDSVTADLLTGVEHDYRVLRFEPPTCEYKVFKMEE